MTMLNWNIANLLRRSCSCLLVLCLAVASASIFAAQGITEQSYRLGAGDEIAIRVFGEDDMNVQARIGESGLINYPFLGELKVTGITAGELEQRILKGLKGPYLVDPIVSVNITTYRPFFVNGEVVKPGAIPFQPGITVRKAIAISGGFTERAQRKSVEVIRGGQPGESTHEAGLDQQVSPGDIITVKESFF